MKIKTSYGGFSHNTIFKAHWLFTGYARHNPNIFLQFYICLSSISWQWQQNSRHIYGPYLNARHKVLSEILTKVSTEMHWNHSNVPDRSTLRPMCLRDNLTDQAHCGGLPVWSVWLVWLVYGRREGRKEGHEQCLELHLQLKIQTIMHFIWSKKFVENKTKLFP